MQQRFPPRFDDWPATLISSARLTGALVACGPGVRAVGWPETPVTRATALSRILGERYVAIDETAAWVWGAMHSPGASPTVSTRTGRVPLRDYDGIARKQYRFDTEDLVELGEQWVTSVERTAYDLLRADEPFSVHRRVACRLLFARDHSGVTKILDRLPSASRADRARVRSRLQLLYDISS